MKLYLYLMIMGLIPVHASLYSQNTNMSIHVANLPMRDALKQVEQASGLHFFMSDNLAVMDELITVDVQNKSFDYVMNTVLKGRGLSYKIFENNVVVITESTILSQGITITGTVTGDDGQPLPGVNVVIKGTVQGTVTDARGAYSLQVPNGNTTLTFSFMGFSSQEFLVGDQRSINVSLSEDTRELEEVVVVGYGTVKKVNLTGSVASVKFSESMESRPATNLSSAIAGLLPGLVVQQGNSAPGNESTTLRVRGVGTLNNSDPLVLIDGVPGNINDVNSYDVESISVLKDAASSAIYGSRAANGVILITTKRGESNKLSITYNGYVGNQSAARMIDYITDYPTLLELKNEALRNSNQPITFQQADIDEWRTKSKTDPLNYPNTDWFREVLKPSVITEHNISARGGNDKSNFMMSLGYLDNKGVMENAGYKRYSFRLNADSKVNDWFSIGSNIFGFWSDRGPVNWENVFTDGIRQTNPGILPKSEDGRYGGSMFPNENVRANNPLAQIQNSFGNNERQRVGAKFFAKVSFLKYFDFESSFAADLDNKRSWSYWQPTAIWNFRTNNILYGGPGSSRNGVSNSSERYYSTVLNEVLRFNYTLNEVHHFSALAGFDQEYSRMDRFEATKYDLINGNVPILDAAAADPTAKGTANDRALRSFYGRINYDYAGKYLFEANARYDGSSRFSEDLRWGFFPSFSAGWRISEEAFFEPVKQTVSNLKLRGSWGKLGNNNIGDYEYQSLYAAQNYSFNGGIVLGLAPTAIFNSIITWESTTITDIGLDMGFFDNHLSVSLDYFDKMTNDILVRLPISGVMGNLTAPSQNAGKVQNKGWEIQLDYHNRVGDFNYSAGFNLSRVKNEVVKYRGKEITVSDNIKALTEGQPINAIYVREVDHIVQDKSEIDQLIADGWTFNPGTPQPGDFLYKDLNDDKKIDDNDRSIRGSSIPKLTYGLNLSASWKGIDLYVFGQGVRGLDTYWENHMNTSNISTDSQVRTNALDRWTPDNKTDKFPRLTVGMSNNTAFNDFWMYSISYFKIRSLQAGYTLPHNITSKFYVNRLRIYTSFENFFTFTKYDGFDPENAGLTYPSMKQWVMGINLTF